MNKELLLEVAKLLKELADLFASEAFKAETKDGGGKPPPPPPPPELPPKRPQ